MKDQQTVVVTGGSGYIGRPTCELLVAAGYNVINIDRGKSDIPGVTLYPFDLGSSQVRGVLEIAKPDAIIHFAASHFIPDSLKDPGSFYENNVSNTISLLRMAHEIGIKHFIFSSSSSVYGDHDDSPTPEDYPHNPVSPYSKSKDMAEQIVDDFVELHDMNIVSLRYFNVSGALPDNSWGPSAPFLIRRWCEQANNEDYPFKIFGDSYPTRDGTAVRDFTHLSDVAKAHIMVLNYMHDGGKSDAFNIGRGAAVSLKELHQVFEEVLDTTIPLEIIPAVRTGDVAVTYADNSKAKEVLGWEPTYTIHDIVKHSLAWEKKAKKKK